MKKKLHIFFIISSFFLIFWIWKDYKKIDTSYINQDTVTYSFKNLNSNLLKKIHIKIDKTIENTFVKFLNSHRNHWTIEDSASRKALPDTLDIKSNKNFTISKNEDPKITNNWYKSHGNDNAIRFSNLDLINSKNASALEVAWIFRSEGFKGDIQANPIVVNGIIYTPISGGFIAAIDGITGNLIWKSKNFGNSVAKRG